MRRQNRDVNASLGGRIRTLRTAKGWTQQELGNQADVNYKFVGEIERGLQNPSFETLRKIAAALEVELTELFRFEQEILDRNELESRISEIVKTMSDDEVRRTLMVLRALYPFTKS
ncbi:MAG: XRE family transcriptional regulator [Desulfobacteraceae bacterium]|jgi:transcriptional regulator with XRE-family HTH domain|nr:MAG: XRE family transcriptional regulator [Desulfobacteraceae bacterium]